MKILSQPPLTQKLGPWICYENNRHYSAKIGYEIDVMTGLIDNLPPFDLFLQFFHYEVTNWLAFYWKSFRQQTSYTYVIDDISDPDRVFSEFSRLKKRAINKAKRYVEIRYDLPAEQFYRHHQSSLAQLSKKISYSFEYFSRLYTASYENHAGKTSYAVDKNGVITAAMYTIWDTSSAYHLVYSIDPRFRNTGSMSLLVYNMICYLSDKTQKFDFEGSVIKNVEYSYRQFGTRQVPMFKVSKTNSKIISLYNLYRKIY